ncbi:helix-turn-helix domain-containing protein [Sphingopyxis witflariensis]|uniref:Helix-turn-helix domain-containing protein n=1 Tax=Sphingopyxis witflariensis TaxID=173675 RepID=A0A2D0ANF7_9SPHN|nr:helix-turn-helix domain-containing protein [Sphingopyxis witflariensis]OWQ95124.1 hypothetical protein CDQ91_14485 [Sphingopyxis witflariensis]
MSDQSHILPEHDVRPYSVAQLADRWGCSGNVVRKLINQGELQCFRIGSLIRIPAAEVQRFETIAPAPEPVIDIAPTDTIAPTPNAPKRRNIPRAPRAKIRPKRIGSTSVEEARAYLLGFLEKK